MMNCGSDFGRKQMVQKTQTGDDAITVINIVLRGMWNYIQPVFEVEDTET